MKIKRNYLKISNNVILKGIIIWQKRIWELVKVSGPICFSCKGPSAVILKGLYIHEFTVTFWQFWLYLQFGNKNSAAKKLPSVLGKTGK